MVTLTYNTHLFPDSVLETYTKAHATWARMTIQIQNTFVAKNIVTHSTITRQKIISLQSIPWIVRTILISAEQAG